MIIFYLILILFFCFVLSKAASLLMTNLQVVSRNLGLGELLAGALFLGFSASLPEFFVGIASALEGQPTLSLGNIIGSNIANLSLVIGLVTLIGGSLKVEGEFLKRDVFYAFLAGAVPLLLILDKELGRVDGLILLALYGFYNVWVLGSKREKRWKVEEEERGLIKKFTRRFNQCKVAKKQLAFIFLGIALILFCANMIVRLATGLAVLANIPLFLVGLFFVSIGTVLPELVFEIKARRKESPCLVFGTLLGSLVAHGTLILGVVALICPIKIVAFTEYLVAVVAYFFIFGAFYLFIRTKHRLDRWEAAFLVGFYFAFLLAEFIHP